MYNYIKIKRQMLVRRQTSYIVDSDLLYLRRKLAIDIKLRVISKIIF